LRRWGGEVVHGDQCFKNETESTRRISHDKAKLFSNQTDLPNVSLLNRDGFRGSNTMEYRADGPNAQ
jgi:hypothetical protein